MRSGDGEVNLPVAMMMLSPTMKGLAVSFGYFTLSANFQGAVGFVSPSWPTAQPMTSSPQYVTKPTVASIESNRSIRKNRSMPTRHNHGAYTKLWAEALNESENDKKPTKADNKGSQKDGSKKVAKSKSTSKTARKPTKDTSTKTSQTKKQSTKKPLEISAQSLTPSQTKSKAVQSQQQDRSNNKGEEDEANYDATNIIPQTGYSLADQLENKPENKERFETTLTPIVVGIRENKEVEFQYDEDGFPIGYEEAEDAEEDSGGDHEGVARIDTVSTLGNVGEEPVRWLVSLEETNDDGGDDKRQSYAMIDLPPYSDKLADEIRYFMDPEYNITTLTSNDSSKAKASLDVILMTNQQCIHYDSTPAVYVTRKSDLKKWKMAFPSAAVVMYRLDIPRECRDEVTQVLDGYGPWGWSEDDQKLVETGRPLTIEEWDEDTKSKVLDQGELPEVAESASDSSEDDGDDNDPLYSPEAVREREEKHRLLAVYTPGHTFGSVTYIFPKRGICCSGYTLPLESSGASAIEDSYDDEDDLMSSTSSTPIPPQAPRLDYQGYLATSASRPRQMSSANSLINNYIDRFRVVLPARGDVVFLDSEKEARKRELMESVGLYKKIGDIYGRLGIVE